MPVKYKVGEIYSVEMYKGQPTSYYNLVKIVSINPTMYMYLLNGQTYFKKPWSPKLRKLTKAEKLELL